MCLTQYEEVIPLPNGVWHCMLNTYLFCVGISVRNSFFCTETANLKRWGYIVVNTLVYKYTCVHLMLSRSYVNHWQHLAKWLVTHYWYVHVYTKPLLLWLFHLQFEMCLEFVFTLNKPQLLDWTFSCTRYAQGSFAKFQLKNHLTVFCVHNYIAI